MEKITRSRRVPEDLVIEILLRLPVKSLLHFKTLSKYWYNLITSSYFIFKHFLINNNGTHILNSRYLPNSTGRYAETGFSVLSYESLSYHHHDLADFRIPFYMEYIIGPINGLFLLGNRSICHENYRLALLNPATRELKTFFVPDSNLQNPASSSNSILHRFGFGFDSLTNNIKVVAFWNTKEDGLLIDGVNMAVYSLANDSWEHLSSNMPNSRCPDYDGYFPELSDVPYINGSCYWLSKDYYVLSFNFGSDILGEINGPQHIPIPKYGYTSLFIYNYEFLAMFIGTYTKATWNQEIDSIDVLVMKEEGCWTTHLNLDLSHLKILRPVGVWKNQLLLEMVDEHDYRTSDEGVYTFKMAIYNLTTETIKLDIQPHKYSKNHRVFIYNESLVSLKGSGNNKSISDLIHDFFD